MTPNLKWALQKLREELYPSNDKFLNNISKISLTLDDKATLSNIPFCFRYNNILSPDKNNFLEKYIIFTSKFQIKIIKKCTQLFVDGTFKIAPSGYYQVLNIGGFLPEINSIIPFFLIPTSGKSQYLYN